MQMTDYDLLVFPHIINDAVAKVIFLCNKACSGSNPRNRDRLSGLGLTRGPAVRALRRPDPRAEMTRNHGGCIVSRFRF